MRTRWHRIRIVSMMLAASLILFVQPLAGQDEPASEKVAAKTPAVKNEKELHGHLPAHYGKVIDAAQRQRIYAIQEEFAPKIRQLETQLALLKNQRDQRIVAVLTPAQQKKIVELKAAAKAKRKQAKQAGTIEKAEPEAKLKSHSGLAASPCPVR